MNFKEIELADRADVPPASNIRRIGCQTSSRGDFEGKGLFGAVSNLASGTAVTRNGNLLGFIVDRRDGFDAVTAAGRQLGRFNTQAAAARALLPSSDCVGCDG